MLNSFTPTVGQWGAFQVEPFKIELHPGTQPIFRGQYRYAPKEQQFIQDEVDKMLQQKVIRVSRSPCSSPIVLAKKEGGKSKRFCNDFRALNEKTIADKFPLPNVDDCLNVLAGSQYFSTLDCQSGYWQVPLAEDSKKWTAFQAGNAFYEYEVLPFGLKNAPAAFQRMINKINVQRILAYNSVETGLVRLVRWNGRRSHLHRIRGYLESRQTDR